MPRLQFLIAFLPFVFLQSGCSPRDEVRVLKVPKEPNFTLPTAGKSETPADEPAVEARMLAAIVPYKQRVWFFKMIGSPDDIRAQRGEFRRLLESISFDDQEEPQWELPDTWNEQAGSGMRKATLMAGTGQRAPSVSVIGLAAPQEVLGNINRWRQQLQLPPVSAEQLSEFVDTFEVAGAKVTLADISGAVNPQLAMGGPLPASSPANAPRGDRTNNPSARPARSTEFTFNVPSGWNATPAGGMRKASFAVRDGEQQAEITVISLPPTAGDLLPNVNRWRAQLGLEPLDEGTIGPAARAMEIAGHEGQYVERMPGKKAPDGDVQATVAAMVPHGGAIWFFKLTGNGALVEREEANFAEFLESVEFAN